MIVHEPKGENSLTLILDVTLDARAGGRFNTVFAGPAGERRDNKGMFLSVDPMKSLVFTDGYTEGYIPAPAHFMTGFVELSDEGAGETRMIWGARHATAESAKAHLDMGFRKGWRAAAQQLEDEARRL